MAKGSLTVPREALSQPVVSDTKKSQKRRALNAESDPQLVNNELDYLHERINGIVVEDPSLLDLPGGATLADVIVRLNSITQTLRRAGLLKP